MMNLNFSYFGGRDYIDIAQICYRAMYPFFGDDYSSCTGFYIAIHKSVMPLAVLLDKAEFEKYPPESFEIAAKLRFQKNGTFDYEGYICNPVQYPIQNTAITVPEIYQEPTYLEGIHYKLDSDKIQFLEPIQTQWPVFFTIMLLGRFAAQHFYGSIKPRAVAIDSNSLPSIEQLPTLHGLIGGKPHRGIIKVPTYFGGKFVGNGMVKI